MREFREDLNRLVALIGEFIYDHWEIISIGLIVSGFMLWGMTKLTNN